MTAAELRTLMEALNITDAMLADIGGVALKSAQRWKAGDRQVPEDIAQALCRLDALHERAALEAVEQWDAAGRPRLVLLRYGSAGDLARYRPRDAAAGPRPERLHAALIRRVAEGVRRVGGDVRIVELDAEDYEAWRIEERLDDGEDARAAWAAWTVDAACDG